MTRLVTVEEAIEYLDNKKTIDINVVRLGAHATSYGNCLWSHCIGEGVNKSLVDLLYQHAHYVALNADECWQFLKERDLKEVHWKHCQYFFALCWPIAKPWMELNKHVITKLIEAELLQEPLPISGMIEQRRPIIERVQSVQLSR